MNIKNKLRLWQEGRYIRLQKSDRMQAYEGAVESANTSQGAKTVQVDTVLDTGVDRIIKAANAGWPDWTRYMGMLTTKSYNARQALHAEARRRIALQCPELDHRWYHWVSSAKRKAYYRAELKIVQSLTQEVGEHFSTIDREIDRLDGSYEKTMFAKFKKGGVKIRRKRSSEHTAVLSAVGTANKNIVNKYKNYKEFPPEVRQAQETEERLMDDLVTKYDIIKPEQADDLFQQNQNGEVTLRNRIVQYFSGKQYMASKSEGALLLQKMAASADGQRSIERIRKHFLSGVDQLRYRRLRNPNLWYYRVQNRLRNPNVSPATLRKYLLEKRPVPGTRVHLKLGGQKLDLFVKCRVQKQGTIFVLRSVKGATYVLDLGANEGGEQDAAWVVAPGPDGKGDEKMINIRDVSIPIAA
jgi:hypothetical protein